MGNKTENGLKQTVENLIKAGTTYDLKQLESIYHQNLKVIMIDEKGQKILSNKESFKALFQTKLKNGDAPLNDWAEFNHIEQTENKGLVIVTRKVNLTGVEKEIVLSIDLIWEENRWQVTREVIFTQRKN
ncbi:hypothetical protein M0D21_02555 [Aquimarina sp. D1M17]|uniref:hypothetical protein n=1 Tax=Aquimarina acroporae TaxID=2937283 RepID=UPI0020BDEEC0|nr:hypothetical protein [Aquimarina acroporae]MCK8520429.1 hypothetical protein [Aquimarina acroporae]